MTALAGRALGAAAGILVDRLAGEPPAVAHPVVAFGAAMRRTEAALWSDGHGTGAAYAAAGVSLGVGAGALVGSTAVATTLAVGGRALAGAATAVSTALAGDDLDGARSLLPGLVGRDPDGLDTKDMARAVVESVAENTVDAVVAPALWATAAGAAGALGYRAANTLDAMVGHRSPRYGRFGWASARIDDVAGWVPARVTAALVMAVRPRSATAVWRAVRHDAPHHPSPNAGVAEAAFAAALGLRLGGSSTYGGRVELRPSLGDGRPPETLDIARAVHLSTDVSLALAAVLAAGGVAARWLSARAGGRGSGDSRDRRDRGAR
ncbi:MAG TPA: adenosylcobinamide-phosphate synthase CbiB [Acidimicrobiales bacterium]|nr:adenosylcobinamide-phosphate synthase CbiB [Acidimicrobiales bacterium]